MTAAGAWGKWERFMLSAQGGSGVCLFLQQHKLFFMDGNTPGERERLMRNESGWSLGSSLVMGEDVVYIRASDSHFVSLEL